MPRDLLEVKDRMLHNGVYFCANYATWHYLALLGTIWQHWATKCHESSPLSSEPGPPASYCIIWFLYCAILRFPVFPCLSLFSLESTRLPPVSSCVFFRWSAMAPGGFAASCHTSRFALQHLGPAAGHRLLRSHLCLAVA